MPTKVNAYLDGTVNVGKEVQTIQRYKLEPYMWEKRYKLVTGTVHVGKCFLPEICQDPPTCGQDDLVLMIQIIELL